jgi:hypothetical protein
MSTTVIAAFLVFGLVMAAMAVGVIFSNRRLQGSCGGLGNLRDELGQPLCECGSLPGSCGAGEKEIQEEKVAAHS